MDDLLEANEQHPRIIIHIDMDYYYAQVEEILDPSLKDKPVGIKQRFHVVTSNYVAREYGIKKMMLVTDAKKLCPNLVLVNGEDLTKYREMSGKIFEIYMRFTPLVEKLGLDENYLDVTTVINEQMEQMDTITIDKVEGYIHPPPANGETDLECFQSCNCGCAQRLILGTKLAKEIRDTVFRELGMRCCAGIAHNKLLAKIVGSMNKQNKQTVLIPACSTTFLASLESLKTLTGIGEKTASVLGEMGIKNISDLQECSIERLKRRLGHETACRLKDMSVGRDESAVKPTGKPKSVGLEDSCDPISIKADAEEKFRHLLVRLMKNIAEDGRMPITIKVTVRKVDPQKKTSHRETRQDKIQPSSFKFSNGRLVLADGAADKILSTVMKLFERMVDLRQPFTLTLLGLSFCKFQERKVGSKSIANFLIKKSDVEVQSITNLSNESITLNDSYASSTNRSIVSMDYEQTEIAEMSSDMSLASYSGSESDEPSPKKTRRLGNIIMAKGIISNHMEEDSSSPSKLRVADLRLNSREYDRASNCSPSLPSLSSTSLPVKSTSLAALNSSIPPNVDPDVFKELPIDVQNELLSSWRTPQMYTQQNSTPKSTATSSSASSSLVAANGKNTLLRYFVKNS